MNVMNGLSLGGGQVPPLGIHESDYETLTYCDWYGVTCDETKDVVKLELSSQGIS